MKFRHTVYIFALAALPAICGANNQQYAQERAVYQQALHAIQTKNESSYEQARHLLRDYPLVSYLEYEYLERHFSELPDTQIERFLKKYEGSYIASKLHSSWLTYLGQHQKWELYTRFYQPELATDTTRCYDLQAELALSPGNPEVYRKIGEQWLQPDSQPDTCNRVFAEWKKQGHQTQEMVFQRFQLALTNRNARLARQLAQSLKGKYSTMAQRLLVPAKHQNYWEKTLSSPAPEIALESRTVKYILKTLADRDHERVTRLLEQHRMPMQDADLAEIQRLCAWYLAKTSGSAAEEWLARNGIPTNPEVYDSRLRFALQDKEWATFQKVFNQAPAATQAQQEWLYWYAISQQESGVTDKNPDLTADAIFTRLSGEFGFYAVLAAERKNLRRLPQISQQPVSLAIDRNIERKLAPAFEFYSMKQTTPANREWHHTTKKFTKEEWVQAGILAYNAGWHERTIQAFSKAEMWGATEERFPLVYQEHFSANSKKQMINEGWLLAMARQESAFSAGAKSPVGALGVLQLMPTTAKKVAGKMRMPFSEIKLLDPGYNIALGSRYLKDMLTSFDNNYVLATAAYNAGPLRVKEWLDARPITDDWVHWVATIPYKETRQYVQNIMTFSKVYQHKLESRQVAQLESATENTATFVR